MDSTFIGKDGFVWWKGVVEDRKDPIFLGRVRVRIFGWHTDDKQQLPTEDLPWAMPSLPFDNGRNPVGLKEGDWVWGFFMDGPEAQKPIVVGFIPGIDEDKANPEVGFFDPTPDEQLNCESVPRPPEMCPVTEGEATEEQPEESNDKHESTKSLPGANTAFGVLTDNYDHRFFKFDVNKDGVYNQTDANLITDLDGDGVPNNENEFFDGTVKTNVASAPISRYPLETRLMEPTTSRLARNEKIEQTIVGLKTGEVRSGEGGGYDGALVGGDGSAAPLAFQEPPTPYAAVYPYNHVYESESGHVIEIDDTPNAQRLHWYHRSGTFKEIHPDGIQVEKIVKSQYNFVYDDYFHASGKSTNFDAMEAFRVKSGQVINLNAGSDINRQAGSNLNAKVGSNVNTRVGENTHTIVEEESWTHVYKGIFIYVKEDVLHIKAKKDILIESEEGRIQLTSPVGIDLSAPKITLQGPGGGSTDINMVSSSIKANYLVAHQAGMAFPGIGNIPQSPTPVEAIKNKADDSSWYSEMTEVSVKPGYVLPCPPGTMGDIWKPISDSNGNLVTLSTGSPGTPHELYEALPSGELEAVKIKYQHADMVTFTEWEVVRPKHIKGDLIERCSGTIEPFEGSNKYLNRWGKPGGEYPKQLIWVVPGASENLIMDSSQRHQAFVDFPDYEIQDFNFKQTLDKNNKKVGEDSGGSGNNGGPILV